MATQGLALTSDRPSLSAAFAGKYAVDQKNIFALLKETALKSKDPVSDAEVAAFMIVCNQYDLNPFIKEIYGFISKGKMQYVISVDGWATLVNRQPNLNGIEFEEHFAGGDIRAITCRIHRKDRALPTVVTEYFSECRRDTDTWKTWPIRMLRHKAMIQCSRIAFGLAGVLDEDEADRMEQRGDFGPIIEASPKATPEIEGLMDKLTWTPAQKNMARRNFGNDEAGFISYLKDEIAKMGQPEAKSRKKAEAKPQEVAKETENPTSTADSTAKPAYSDAGQTETKQTEKPTASPTFDNW